MAEGTAYVIFAANMKALLIDHDDSFTQNLKHWLMPIFTEVKVVHHSFLQESKNFNTFEQSFDLLVLSPGPKGPQDYPHTLNFLKNLKPTTYVYGVCLGLQMLAITSRATTSIYSPPKHGKISKLKSVNSTFQNLGVARYHSIKANVDIHNEFNIHAESADDLHPMWIQHKSKKWMGVQFHPESFLTEKPELHLKALQDWLQT